MAVCGPLVELPLAHRCGWLRCSDMHVRETAASQGRVSSLQDSVPVFIAYPGLTSWAKLCRPFGALARGGRRVAQISSLDFPCVAKAARDRSSPTTARHGHPAGSSSRYLSNRNVLRRRNNRTIAGTHGAREGDLAASVDFEQAPSHQGEHRSCNV